MNKKRDHCFCYDHTPLSDWLSLHLFHSSRIQQCLMATLNQEQRRWAQYLRKSCAQETETIIFYMKSVMLLLKRYEKQY